MTASRALIKQMKERYKELLAVQNEKAEALEEAKRDFYDARNKKNMYEQLLESEGVNVQRIISEMTKGETDASSNGNSAQLGAVVPLSNTHAVYLLLRNNDPDNAGLTLDEIEQHGASEYNLTPQDIAKVIWRQTNKELLEKAEDGRIRQTEEGLKFNSFRKQKADE
jgi:hypothetical protein